MDRGGAQGWPQLGNDLLGHAAYLLIQPFGPALVDDCPRQAVGRQANDIRQARRRAPVNPALGGVTNHCSTRRPRSRWPQSRQRCPRRACSQGWSTKLVRPVATTRTTRVAAGWRGGRTPSKHTRKAGWMPPSVGIRRCGCCPSGQLQLHGFWFGFRGSLARRTQLGALGVMPSAHVVGVTCRRSSGRPGSVHRKVL